jgi:membrane dipeptidase
MIVVDAHRDIAYDAFLYEHDYRLSVAEMRAREAGTERAEKNGLAVTGLPDALRGRVGLVFATLFLEPASYEAWATLGQYATGAPQKYSTPQEAHDLALKQLDYYVQQAAETPQIKLVLSQRDLEAVLATWEDGAPEDQRQQGYVILMEGAEPILEPKQFGDWYRRGVRIVGTSWTRTRYAGGTRAPGPLTDLGRALLDEMAKYNTILDLSHMSEEACLESLDRYPGIVIASHSNPRRFCNTDRHLSDDAIKRLAARDGVMGLVLHNVFLETDYQEGEHIPLSRVIDAIDYVCNLTGSPAYVGIGTDWYSADGIGKIPDGFDSVADLIKIGDPLRARGYSEDAIAAILGGNFIRKLRQTLPPG